MKEFRDPERSRRWLDRFRDHAVRADDVWHAEEHGRLRAALDELSRETPQGDDSLHSPD